MESVIKVSFNDKEKNRETGKFSLALLIVTLIMVSFVSANLGTYKQNECVPIRVLANCSDVDLTEVTINSDNTFVINSPMTLLGGQTFNYTFCNTSELGLYTYSWNNYCADCSQGDCGNSFEITGNGKPTPSGSVAVLFILFFLILNGWIGLYTSNEHWTFPQFRF